jgi:hypothetical protein
MKVELLKDECGRFEIVVKKRNKIIAVSTLVENVASLETYYVVSDSSDEDDPSFIYSKSVLTIRNSRNRIKVYADIKRNLSSKAIEYNHFIYSRKDGKTDVNTSFVIYYKVKKK